MKFNDTSSTTFSVNFATNKGDILGCFTGFLSRILCSKTLPTYPSSEPETRPPQFSTAEEAVDVDGRATTNVVARLMGLEKSWKTEDYRAETEDTQRTNRRVKMSFSFVTTPTYFEIQDDDFFVLSFEKKTPEKKKKKSNFGQCSRNKCRRKQRVNREEQGKNRVMLCDDGGVKLRTSPPRKCRKFDVDVICRSRETVEGDTRGNCREMISEGEVQNCSPVSVLDDTEFISNFDVTISGNSEEDANSRGFECEKESISSIKDIENEEIEENEEKIVGLRRKNYRKRENLEMLRRIFGFAEEELNNNSNWKYKGMFCAQEFEEIVLNFSHHIFDQLISDLVDNLIDF
ncbi:hypothetical protein vseg_013076 [Gypsophila vaccaria]